MSAQQRTLDDLKIGINVQIDKGGHIRYRQQPQMGLPSIDIIDKSIVATLKRENGRLTGYLRELREMLVWDSDHRGDYKRLNELRPIIDALLITEE